MLQTHFLMGMETKDLSLFLRHLNLMLWGRLHMLMEARRQLSLALGVREVLVLV
jgi:hypothetical protein